MAQITVLDMVKAHDGKGSGLDADLVQGVPKDLLGIGGDGYQWKDETSNRSAGTIYTNTTGKPIMVSVIGFSTTNCSNNDLQLYIDDLLVAQMTPYCYSSMSAIVQPNKTYKVIVKQNASLAEWFELK